MRSWFRLATSCGVTGEEMVERWMPLMRLRRPRLHRPCRQQPNNRPRKQGSNEECSQGGLPGEAKAGADFQWCLRPFALHDREDDSEQQKHDRRG